MKTANPECPKCGTKMMRNGYTPGGSQRWVCYGPNGKRAGGFCYTTTAPESEAVTRSGSRKAAAGKTPVFRRNLTGVRRLLVTSAQNATPVHAGFLKAMQTYCKANNAELVVVPIRYKNPTSRWTASQQNAEWWADEVQPYLCNQRKKLCANLVLLGDIKTRPTAECPLTGFEGITHGESGILGHSKMQLRSIPTPSHSLPKVMATTGSVTRANYTDSKEGKKGEFHHVYGALVVEIKGKKFNLRQINAESDGSFIDWTKRYTAEGKVEMADAAAALVMGDTHYRFMDPLVRHATFGPGGIIRELSPHNLVWHDLLDGYSCNPHHGGNPFIEIGKRADGGNLHDVRNEVLDTAAFLCQSTAMFGCRSILVSANHDDFLRRWIMNTDWRKDPKNAQFYLETALVMARSATMGASGAEYKDPFTHWVEQTMAAHNKRHPKHPIDIKCLRPNESISIAGIECGMHGHLGPNGVRGTLRNLSNLGVKAVIGHSHTPGIHNGTFQTATSSRLQLEYNNGPSSWLNGHVVVYANGKRSHIFIIDGEYRY